MKTKVKMRTKEQPIHNNFFYLLAGSLTFMPSIRESALRGLNPLKVLKTLKIGMSAAPHQEAKVLINEN